MTAAIGMTDIDGNMRIDRPSISSYCISSVCPIGCIIDAPDDVCKGGCLLGEQQITTGLHVGFDGKNDIVIYTCGIEVA